MNRTTDGIRAVADAAWAEARRDEPGPTIAVFAQLLEKYPDEPLALFHLARAHDYAGEPAEAAPIYERAFAGGLDGDERRSGLISYGSTLRNLDRLDEAVSVLEHVSLEFPASVLARCYLALALYSADRSAEAVSQLLALTLDRVQDEELQAGRLSLANYAAALRHGYWAADGWKTL